MLQVQRHFHPGSPQLLHLCKASRELYNRCNYCMPCPNGVNIPANFEIYNEAFLHEDIPGARFKYQIFITEAARASVCVACHDCEDHCPQKIPISEWMPKVHALLGAA